MTTATQTANPYAGAIAQIGEQLDDRKRAQVQFAAAVAEAEAEQAEIRSRDQKLKERIHALFQGLQAPVEVEVISTRIDLGEFSLGHAESNGVLPKPEYDVVNRISHVADTDALTDNSDNEIDSLAVIARIQTACDDKKGAAAIRAAAKAMGETARSAKDLVDVAKTKSFVFAVDEMEFVRAVFEAAGVTLPD